MKLWQYGILFLGAVGIAALSYKAFELFAQSRIISREYDSLSGKVQSAEIDQTALRNELEALANPIFMEKQLRTRFNYRAADEKMIILVPRSTATNTAGAPAPSQ